jgi:hypothetical protein
MFGATTRRLREALANEKTCTTHLRGRLHDTDLERDSWKWAAQQTTSSQADLLITRTRERDEARSSLRATEDQLAAARRENAARTGKQIDYSNRAVGNMRRLARALRACARYRAELAAQQRTVDRLSRQVLDATGYDRGEHRPEVSA